MYSYEDTTYEDALHDEPQQNQQSHIQRHINLTIETLIGAFSGIFLGYLVDFIFPEPKKDEKIGETVGWVILQIFVDSLIAYWVIFLVSEYTIRFNQAKYEGMVGFLLFGILFFLVQVQLLNRLSVIYSKITGRSV